MKPSEKAAYNALRYARKYDSQDTDQGRMNNLAALILTNLATNVDDSKANRLILLSRKISGTKIGQEDEEGEE